jgi:hypothetical protein
MAKNLGGLATHTKAYNPFIKEVLARQTARRVEGLARFLDAQRMQCPGGCGLIHETNMQAHNDYGCEVAAKIGRGPIKP